MNLKTILISAAAAAFLTLSITGCGSSSSSSGDGSSSVSSSVSSSSSSTPATEVATNLVVTDTPEVFANAVTFRSADGTILSETVVADGVEIANTAGKLAKVTIGAGGKVSISSLLSGYSVSFTEIGDAVLAKSLEPVVVTFTYGGKEYKITLTPIAASSSSMSSSSAPGVDGDLLPINPSIPTSSVSSSSSSSVSSSSSSSVSSSSSSSVSSSSSSAATCPTYESVGLSENQCIQGYPFLSTEQQAQCNSVMECTPSSSSVSSSSSSSAAACEKDFEAVGLSEGQCIQGFPFLSADQQAQCQAAPCK